MKTVKLIPWLLVAAAGAAVGYGVGSAPKSESAVTEEVRPKAAPKAIADEGLEASVKALRRRVAELERELAAKSEAQTSEEPVAVEETKEPAPGEKALPHGFDFRAGLEQMKKDNPEGYKALQQRMEDGRAWMRQRSAGRREFLTAVNTEGMSPEQLQTHNDYLQVLAKEDELRERMMSQALGENAESGGDRRAFFEEMRDLHQRRRELERAERDILLMKTAESFGYRGDDAAELVDTVKSVYESTSGMMPFGPPHRGERGGSRR